MARPPAPGKPSVEARNGAVRISVAADPASGASGYHYECSADNGTTWPAEADAASATDAAAQVGNLTNGVAYVCRAFAESASGQSDASPLSDAVKPCGSLPECLGIPLPLVGIAGVALVGAFLLGLLTLLRSETGGYVIAVVDVVHTANLGNGSKLGIRFERHPDSREVDGIVADRGSGAEIRVRRMGGDRFKVTDRNRTYVTESGEPVVAVDSKGVRHELVLRAFAGKAASAVSDHR
jgi:hypothetical protein